MFACAFALAVASTAISAAEPAAAPAAAEKSSVAAATTSTAPAKKVARSERKICKTVVATGSRLGKRTCATKAQWEEVEKASQAAMQDAQDKAQMRNMKGGG